jgi:hypothetical protein
MFQPLKGHLQGVQLIYSSSMSQQNKSPVVQFWTFDMTQYVTHLTLQMHMQTEV